MSVKSPLKTYIGAFTFAAPEVDSGQFKLIVQEKSLNRAEKVFRKKIKSWLKTQPTLHPCKVFIQDVIEIDGHPEFDPVIFFLRKDSRSETNHHVFFSPLPLREPHATSWAMSMPEDQELFLESEEP
ncbi:MAG: hypothetical protein JJU35_08220 [Balneolales bacterium]|nr:hypothetical protein [Balneolales bacterium]